MEYSCLKTLANKHKTTISKVVTMFKDGRGRWGIPYETKTGRKRCYFAKLADCKESKNPSDIKRIDGILYATTHSSLESRLKAKVCELCGTTKSDHYQIHHVNKIKNLKGKQLWEKVMIARQRKTLVVCPECHYGIHHQ